MIKSVQSAISINWQGLTPQPHKLWISKRSTEREVYSVQIIEQENDLIYFEDLDSSEQEIIIELIVSIIENKKKKTEEG